MIETKSDILDILKMPEDVFFRDIAPKAKKIYTDTFGKKLRVTSMMGYSNICRNMCLYCGMRAENPTIKRYRTLPEDVISMALAAADAGYGRIFLISGEDPLYGFDNLLGIVRTLKNRGMYVSLACGEFSKEQFMALRDVGTDEYVIKFEMSNPKSFNYLNPSTTFEKRMKAIEIVKNSGMRLASGNIVDWPGQTDEELAEDILLMKKLDISWAPIIPYLPAANTPLAAEGKRGDLLKIYKEIAILRIMMPRVHITAQQPGADMKKGLSDPEANLAAINVGADVLFFDLLPDPHAQNFRVIDDRNISGPSHIFKIAEFCGYELDTGKENLL
ncbi:MAG: radical SAM protein [Spirochaetaceae bacterium]|nr:radical SAM protein [Spirochaetaceae bacterium]